jgi:hypothetical protein
MHIAHAQNGLHYLFKRLSEIIGGMQCGSGSYLPAPSSTAHHCFNSIVPQSSYSTDVSLIYSA